MFNFLCQGFSEKNFKIPSMKKQIDNIDPEESNNYLVPNLDRACSVMEFLAERGVPCALSDIARILDIPKNSIFRILYTLQKRGFVRLIGNKYQLSSKLLSLGYSVVIDSSLLEKSQSQLRKLRDQTRETVGFAVLTTDNSGVVLEQFSSLEPIKISISIGHRFPLHTAAPGKAMVAFLPEEQQEQIIKSLNYHKFTENTITTPEAYRNELAKVRILGYAMDIEEEARHIVCCGTPIFDHMNKVVAALWITGPIFRLTEEKMDEFKPYVLEAGLRISRELGFSGNI